jgi:transcriptional regulator with XRE-family HTH domain
LGTVSGSREIGETIGYQLRRLRRLRGLTQEELADRASMSRDLVAKLEQGRRQTARLSSLVSLACALDVELSALVKRAGDGVARTTCLDAATAEEYAALDVQLSHIFAASVPGNAEVATELAASVAGNDPGPLATVQRAIIKSCG